MVMDWKKISYIFQRYGLALFLGSVVFFALLPRFDLQVSRLFFSDRAGTFAWKDHIVCDSIYNLANFVGLTVMIVLPVLIAASVLIKREFLVQRRGVLLFLLAAWILGPGLLVNGVFKEKWDRPRPREVIEFGGQEQYEPPLAPSFVCGDCHSFVSGHASIGFYFFSLALLSRNRKLLWLPVLAGSAIGAVRIAQGGHFFSDVFFSGWIVWFSSIFLYALFCKLNLFDARAMTGAAGDSLDTVDAAVSKRRSSNRLHAYGYRSQEQ